MAEEDQVPPVEQPVPAPQPPAAFDIAELATEDTAEMAVNHPETGAPTTWVWIIAGPGHPAAIKADREWSDEQRRETLAQDKARINGRKWNPDFVDSVEQQAKFVKYFSQKVLNWTPAKINGSEFPYSQENIKKILLDQHYRAVYSQYLDFINDDKSFMKPSSKN